MTADAVCSTQTDALFVSNLQPSTWSTAPAIQAAIAGSIRAHGSRGRAALVAQKYGEHPETAVLRMAWARKTVVRLNHACYPAGAT
jgi:hypothetical protein